MFSSLSKYFTNTKWTSLDRYFCELQYNFYSFSSIKFVPNIIVILNNNTDHFTVTAEFVIIQERNQIANTLHVCI